MRLLRRADKEAEAVLEALDPRPKAVMMKKQRVADWMRKGDGRIKRKSWAYETPRNGMRRRLYELAIAHHVWWDWGHRVLILIASDSGGSRLEVEYPTWWYRRVPAKPMRRTGYPRSRFEVITDYTAFRARTEGLNEDDMYKWQALAVDSDDQLILGHRYWGGQFFGLRYDEWPLLRRYLRMCRRQDWWGLRSWLCAQALHASVHKRKPRTCQQVPPRNSNGYSHWHCMEKRGHSGQHRFHEYTWNNDSKRVEHRSRR